MNIKCFLGFHDYTKDCEKCSRCEKSRINAHLWTASWEGINCECKLCGRKKPHELESQNSENCMCKHCGAENHEWVARESICHCNRCKLERPHVWEDSNLWMNPKYCKCEYCGFQQDHEWELQYDETLPSSLPGRHRCKNCNHYSDPANVWQSCNCKYCNQFRDADVSTLVSIISNKNGAYYSKSKRAGVYEFYEDPNEVPVALAVLTQHLKNDLSKFTEKELENIASISNVTIHVQAACDEGCKAQDVDCVAAIQLARQELARRRQ